MSGKAGSGAAHNGGPGRHPVDQVLPAPRLISLGLQHVLVMYAGCVAVPLIVGGALRLSTSTIGLLVNADLFTAGIATLIQSVGLGKLLGVRLPVVAGATFVAVTPMILIGSHYGLTAMYGSLIVAGVVGVALARPFSMVLRFFPPLVTGTVITIIGLSLIGAATGLIAGNNPSAPSYAAPHDLGLAALVLVFIVLVTRFGRGIVAQLAVLGGLVLGTLIAIPMGLTNFSTVGKAGIVGMSQPLRFGAPTFEASAIISMIIVMLVTFTESTADMLAVGEMVDRKLSPADIARGLATDGLSAIFAGFFNSFPDTAFAQNVGLVGLTKVRSRFVVAVAGGFLVLLGVLPKIGQVVASLPGPVIGGAALAMFAMVSAVGIRTLARVDFRASHNLLIVAIALGVGMMPVVSPSIYEHFPSNFQVIFGSSITSTVIVVLVLNLLFNELPWARKGLDLPDDKEKADDGIPGAASLTVDARIAIGVEEQGTR
ncbi:MAG: nucleobase:cation symporter-2 family protein [Acidimicrobiales bacterium]